jgi:hypothetical protein
MAAALLLVACGGSSGPNIPDLPAAPVVYTITDGHVEGAWAYCMVSPSVSYSQAPNLKARAASNVNGKFQFDQACNSELLALGGWSLALVGSEKLPFKGLLRAPKGATVLTPITTLMTGSNALSADQIIAALNLPLGTDLLHSDPASVVSGGAEFPELLQKTLMVQQLVAGTAEVMAALVEKTGPVNEATFQKIYDAVATSLVNILTASPSTPLFAADDSVNLALVEAMVQAATDLVSDLVPETTASLTSVDADLLAQAAAPALVAQAEAYLAENPSTNLQAFSALTSSLQESTGFADTLATQAETLTAANVGTIGSSLVTEALSTVSSTTTTTVGSVTTTTQASPFNYLYLTGDSVSYDTGSGAGAIAYTMDEFKAGGGIAVPWPMLNTAAISFTLAEGSAFNVGAGVSVRAALELADVGTTGALVKAYIDKVSVTKSGSTVSVTVPGTAFAKVYARSPTGEELLSGFSDAVVGTSSSFSTSGSASRIEVGSVVNNAVARVGSVDGLVGKTYRMTLVLDGLSLRQASGMVLSPATVVIPGSLAGTGTPVSITGDSLTGFITLGNPVSAPPTTTTTTTTTTSTTTTTIAPSINNYVYLENDTLSYAASSATSPTSYGVSQFQTSPGIAVKWPMDNTAAISLSLRDAGAFNIGSGLTVRAAFEIKDTTGVAQITAYIDNVRLTQSGSTVNVTVPSSAFAKVYAVDASGTELLSSFGDTVVGASSTLSTAAGSTSSLEIGSVVNNALARIGSVSGLTGKTYSVRIVVENLPLRLLNGNVLSNSTITLGTVSITGPSLAGFINLTN